jgi:RND superfamily putative drug exporter
VATLLYRLGRFSFRNPWRVLAVWLVLMVGILGGGFALGGQTEESFAIPGTESQEAIDRLDAVFPQAAGASAQVVVRAPDGATVEDAQYTEAIEQTTTDLADVDGVDTTLSPFSEYATDAISDDASTAIITVQLDGAAEEVSDATIAELQNVGDELVDAGMEVGYGGTLFQDVAYGVTPTEIVGVVFAGIVLFITFGSLLAAGMPLLTAIVGIGVAMGGVISVSAFTTISSATPLLALMIGLAVGIDYGLFILSRHRTQLGNGADPEESAGTSVATAGSAVVFAGVTVIIALLGLLVVNIPFLSAMGVSAAAAVFVAILVSLTALPALMGLAGSRLVPKAGSRAERRATSASDPNHKSFGERWVTWVLKAPVVAVVAVVAVLGTLAIPAFSLTLALPSAASEQKGTAARDAYDLISDGFTEGRNGPLIVLVDITQTTDIFADLDGIAEELRALDDVNFVSGGQPNETVDTAIIQVIPDSGPDDPSTADLVQNIRDLAPGIEDEYNTSISVTGSTAVQIDISNRLNNALIPFGVIVVGLSIVLLMMVFRSVFVPIKAAIGFLLSVLASFGVVVAVFQWGWGAEFFHIVPGPILSFMPILLMAVLFGLAMDYEVFLVSGMRENFVHTGDARGAIVHGFAGAARVVTAAALIMFFVFAAFVPEGAGVIKVIALGLAVGILADAFLVRMTLVPAAMALMGRGAWWMPRWLGRILPNVDIEGESLSEHRTAVEWANGVGADAITAEKLVVGSSTDPVGPVSFTVAPGALMVVAGPARDRALLAATLGGRLDPVSGRAQVAGCPLPSEAKRVARLAALADVSGEQRGDAASTLGDLLEERVRLTTPWYRGLSARRRAHSWLERINATLAEVSITAHTAVPAPLTAHSRIADLPPLGRAVALAAVALTEGTPVVFLDQADAFTEPTDEAAFLLALDGLAVARTTIVLGTPVSARPAALAAVLRPQHTLDLTSFDRKGALL